MRHKSTYCEYPLLFTFSDLVSGDNFAAFVEVCGRALLTVEWEGDEQSFEIASVQPGGFGESGHSFGEASAAFQVFYKSILYDLVSEAKSFDEFKASAEQFISTVDHSISEDWWESAQLMGKGELDIEGLAKQSVSPSDFGGAVLELDTVHGGSGRTRPHPKQNRLPSFSVLAA